MQDVISDEELVSLVQKGDELAFATLMGRYTPKLLRYGHRLMPYENNVGDSVQDVFVKVYENIQDFDATRQFSPWIYRIAHNTFVDQIAKKSKESISVFDFDRIAPHAIYEDPAQAEKEREEMQVLLGQGIKLLANNYREIIDLYYFENFSYKEIADLLHIPLGTVGIRLLRARETLKKNVPRQEL
jgi:RNA polymerase sigma-70 factor (ECF subfamily)